MQSLKSQKVEENERNIVDFVLIEELFPIVTN